LSEFALPCILCGKQLRNVYRDVDNQPNDGVVCFTSGNYGSTVFDSFNGERLEFNCCDNCLVEAGAKGRVWISREKRPVTVEGILIGYEEVPYLPLPWHQGMKPMDNGVDLDEEDLDDLPSTVHVTTDLDMVKKLLADDFQAEVRKGDTD